MLMQENYKIWRIFLLLVYIFAAYSHKTDSSKHRDKDQSIEKILDLYLINHIINIQGDLSRRRAFP